MLIGAVGMSISMAILAIMTGLSGATNGIVAACFLVWFDLFNPCQLNSPEMLL